jgi:hypothetical protein
MDFEQTGSVVLLEHLGSSTFLFDQESEPYTAARRRLDRQALSERATQDTIEAVIERLMMGS